MFSLESFYKILAKNLFEPLDICSFSFESFGSTDFNKLIGLSDYDYFHIFENYSFVKILILHDQEPITTSNFYNASIYGGNTINTIDYQHHYSKVFDIKTFNVIANSEVSDEKINLFKKFNYYDWYYFFHGLAALDWYKNIKYFPPNYNYSKVFICLNNLYTRNRSYRLNLVAKLVAKDLDNYGAISLNQVNFKEKIKEELYNQDSLLSPTAKKEIHENLFLKDKIYVVDSFNAGGVASANDNLDTLSIGLFHLVTETCFYENKLHLTEKIFKPIVSRRPFILVGSKGNLEYLKSYGFRTFDQWIDESYDNESDPDLRISKIVLEIQKLCAMPADKLKNLQKEMQEVTEYNFNHFYGNFKNIVIKEMIDNFELCLKKYNVGKDKTFRDYIDYSILDFDEIKNRLLK